MDSPSIKRYSPFPDLSPNVSKRIKQDEPQAVAAPPTSPLGTRGATWVKVQTTLTDNHTLNTLIIKAAHELSRRGRRISRAPRLLDDGIIFDWILDDSAKFEDLESLLSIEGIDVEALKMAIAESKASSVSPVIIDLLSEEDEKADHIQPLGQLTELGCDANNPILIDDEEEEKQLHEGNFVPESRFPSEYDRIPARIPPVAGPSGGNIPQGRTTVQIPTPDTTMSAEIPPDIIRQLRSLYDKINLMRSSSRQANGSSSSILPTEGIPHGRVVSPVASHYEPVAPAAHTNATQRLSSLYGDFGILQSSSDCGNSDSGSESESERDEQVLVDTTSTNRNISSMTADEITALALKRANGQTARPSLRIPSSDEDSDEGSHRARAKKEAFIPFSNRRSLAKPRPHPRMKTVGRSQAIPIRDRRSKLREEKSRSNAMSSNSSGHYHPEGPTPNGSLARYSTSQHLQHDTSGCEGRSGSAGPRDGHDIVIPKTVFARGRRVLASLDEALPITTIAMRGDASFIDQTRLCRISAYSLPFDEPGAAIPHIVDACLLEDNTVAMALDAGPSQVSLIPLSADQAPRRLHLAHKAHTVVLERSGLAYPNPGISALAPVGAGMRFLSGGHDKTVHLWSVKRRGSDIYSARSQCLPVVHSASVHAIACRTHDEMIYSSAGNCISAMKLDARVAPDPTRVSDGRILQIHVDPRLPHLVILEVDHMDRQVQVYDTRAAGFKQAPALEFGCRDNNTKFKSRYVKGTTSRSFFARPYADDGKGVVRIWDYRKTKEAMFRLVREAPIVHTAHIGSNVVAYGGHLVTIWDTKTS